MGNDAPPQSEYKTIVARQHVKTKRPVKKQRSVGRINEKREARFKAAHARQTAFLFAIFLLHVVGIFLFTKGFLLTRLVLDERSECALPPVDDVDGSGIPTEGCWHPKKFEKAVVILIDALRYDFTVPFVPQDNNSPHEYHDALKVLYDTTVLHPENAFLLPFIADPPTTTLQRLKGLTTGTLPTFIDAGSNFAGTAIDEDNVLAQLKDSGKTLVQLGDDTWHSLFPGYFCANLSRPYDSFNVWDLHTVDNGVYEHLLPLLHASNSSKWDVIIGHFLGVDHAGHRYGPDHPAMKAKLQQIDKILRNLIATIDDSTLLVVMGDHGMDSKGDHGGESDDEVQAALWMYSKKPVFGRSSPEFAKPPATAKERSIAQIDLVPTLSLLLGIPIPFNNLGAPIEEAFIGSRGKDWENLAKVNRLSAAQIKRYAHAYALARGMDENSTFSAPLWQQAEVVADPRVEARGFWGTYRDWKKENEALRLYQREVLNTCKRLWARFDVPSMLHGIGTLLLGVLLLGLYARGIAGDVSRLNCQLLKYGAYGSFFGVGILASLSYVVPVLSLLDGILFGVGGGFAVGAAVGALAQRSVLQSPFPSTFWGWMAFTFTVSQSIGYASNSYTIWEDEIMLFFLATFGVCALVSSLRQADASDRSIGAYHSLTFLVLSRVASLSRLCREEQMPFCKSTYYASASSSTSAPWQLLIPFVVAIVLPRVIKSYYQSTKSFESSAVFWISFALRFGLLLSATFWVLDAADDGGWLDISGSKLKTIKVVVAQIVFGIAFAAGTSTFVWAKPCLNITMTSPKSVREDDPPSSTVGRKVQSLTVLGYSNAHGSRYFLLVSNFILAIILVEKPMGGGAISIFAWQILCLCEIIDTNGLSETAIGPVVLGVLGSFHFFKTGHQATLSSIQWESAFIPLKSIRYPWSPLLVALNTFGAQILAAVSVPLLTLWKQPPKKKRFLSDVTKAVSTHMLYYAVIATATTLWAGYLRRHLMLYRIFSPRFMTAAVVLLVVDLITIFVAIAGFRWNTLSVAEIFGWE